MMMSFICSFRNKNEQQVSETQVPRRSTVSSVDDCCLSGLQRLEIWKGKSHQPDCFGFILLLWSLLLRRQGLARTCRVFSRVPFSFLSPFPLDFLRVCCLSLPPFLSPFLSHHLSLQPSTRVSGRVGSWRNGVPPPPPSREGGGGAFAYVRLVGGGVGWG
jgi:hypothetical protein